MTNAGMDTAAPVIRHAGEGEHAWGMQACATVKLPAGAVEDGRVSVMELLAPAEFGSPMHIHHREDELMQVLEGKLRVVCGDDVDEVVSAGGFAFLPRGVPHAFWVLEGPARMLVVFTPGGVEAMFVDSGRRVDHAELPEPGAVAPGALEPFARRHGVEMTGPPLGG
jgi:quercetin dioxygenase-like cupin family protein